MAISFVGIRNDWVTQFSFTTSWQLNKPTGVQEGDLMIGFLHAGSKYISSESQMTVLTPPSGWTTLRWVQETSPFLNYWIGYRIAGASEPTSWTGAIDQTWSVSSITLAYRGVDTGGPFVVENSSSTSSGTTTLATATVNNNDAASWRVSGFCQRDGTANTWTSTDTERGESVPHTNSWFMSGAVYDSNGTIATGNTSVTGTSNNTWESAASWIGILKAAGSAVEQADAEAVALSTAANKPTPGVKVSVPWNA